MKIFISFAVLILTFAFASNNIEQHKRIGTRYFEKFDFANAASNYIQALKICHVQADNCGLQLKITLYADLSITNLQMFDFKQAFVNFENGLALCPDEECFGLKNTLLYGKAKALIGLGRYFEAINTFKLVSNKKIEGLREFAEKRAFEEGFGLYEKFKATKETNEMLKFDFPMNLANSEFYEKEFVSELIRLSISGSKVRGFFAKRKIEAGELLVVSKAIAYVAKDVWNDSQLSAKTPYDDALVQEVERICNNDPVVEAKIMNLSSGSPSLFTDYPPKNEREQKLHKIMSITYTNSFASSAYTTNDPIPSGLFIAPSFFNHDCRSNAKWTMIGDWIVVRASKVIEINEEVTINYVGNCNTTNLEFWGISDKCHNCRNSLADKSRLYSLNDINATRDAILKQFESVSFNYCRFAKFLKIFTNMITENFFTGSCNEEFESDLFQLKNVALNLELMNEGSWAFESSNAIAVNLMGCLLSLNINRPDLAFGFLSSSHRIFERFYGDLRFFPYFFPRQTKELREYWPGYLETE